MTMEADLPASAAELPERHGAADYSLDEVLISVGERVRNYRKVRGLTLHDVATLTGLSASMISTVERGQTGVSIGSLHAISQALDVSITALFQSDGPGDPVVRKADQRRDTTTGGAGRTLVLADPDLRVEMYVYDFAPDTASAETPTTHNGVEIGFTLEGEITVETDGQKHVLTPGDAIRYPTRTAHRMSNTGATPARGVWINLSRM